MDANSVKADSDSLERDSTERDSLPDSPVDSPPGTPPEHDWSDIDTDDVRSQTSSVLRATRPNRWPGKRATWLKVTQAERLVATALDRARNRDLGVHLYNAYALKAGGRQGRDGWRPKAAWTSWPLRLRQLDARKYAVRGPGAALEEVLLATTQRLARERFRRRADFRGAAWEAARQAEITARRRKNPTRPLAEEALYGRPDVLGDDAASAALLLPAVRHTRARLDRTLRLLHDARLCGLAPDADSDEDTAPRKHRKSRAKHAKRAVADPDQSRPPAAGLSDRHAAHVAEWALRDWRDVVGTAALAGFHPDVLARTAQRCADLFGQPMALDTMHEGSRDTPIEHKVYAPRENERYHVTDLAEEELQGQGQTDGQMGGPADGQSEVNEQDKQGKQDKQGQGKQGQDMQGQDGQGTQAKPSKVYVPPRKTALLFECPFTDCVRAKDGFDRRFNLVRHLRLVHAAEATADKADVLCSITVH